MAFMSKVTIKGLPQVKESVQKLFESIRTDKELLTEIGANLVVQTQAFNRAGKTPSGGKHENQISDEWIERKERLKTVNNVSEYYREGASNLTFTGQLLRSIKFKINQASGSVSLFMSGARKPYKNLDGTLVKDVPTNDELRGYLEKKGWKIFGLNKQISNTTNRIVRGFINNKIKKSIFRSSKG